MFTKKAWNFIKKNVFRIGVIFCVAVIGVVAVVSSIPGQEEDPTEIVDKTESETLDQAEDRISSQPEPSQTSAAGAADAVESSSSADSALPASANRKAANVSLKKPLDGEIINAFSGDTLVFNSTLNMWMTHNGIDISAEKSTEVVAALPGEISSIINDDSKGKTVEITHSNGATTVYSGLSDVIVEDGGKVNAGQKLGTAGTPAFESDLGPHLHFEYLINGVYKDPAEYFG